MREERWNEAIYAYRDIIQKAPALSEARFNLARAYQMAGHLGLALREYDELRSQKDELGPNHVFVIESERAFMELRRMLTKGNKRET